MPPREVPTLDSWSPRILSDFLDRSARVNPDRPAIVAGDDALTYASFRDRCGRLACALRDRGVERGDRVAIFLDNSPDCAVAIYGALLAGAVFVVINPQTRTDKLRYILNDCGAAILVSDVRLQAVFEPAMEEVESLRGALAAGAEAADAHIEDLQAALDAAEPGDPAPVAIPVDLAGLIYTSGSTGLPKGVMMTHQAMVFATGSLTQYLRLDASDRILCVLPLAFDYGLYQLLMSVALGATLVLERSFVFPKPIFEAVERHAVTVFPGVPSIFATLVTLHGRSPLCFPGVRRVTNTAAALPPDQIPVLQEIFPQALIFKMYGLTECKRVSYLEPELLAEKPASVGRAIPGTEVYLLSEDDQPVAAGEAGILHVRGPHVMKGYWNDPERTARMLRPGPWPGEYVLRTGDVFRQDEEGFLYFQGRSDDIIKSRGEKVSPREVENVLYGIEGVHEAIVIGVPDPILGEAVRALIVRKADGRPDRKEVLRTCREHLEGLMVPREVVFVDEFPHTTNGKIDRKALQAASAEG